MANKKQASQAWCFEIGIADLTIAIPSQFLSSSLYSCPTGSLLLAQYPHSLAIMIAFLFCRAVQAGTMLLLQPQFWSSWLLRHRFQFLLFFSECIQAPGWFSQKQAAHIQNTYLGLLCIIFQPPFVLGFMCLYTVTDLPEFDVEWSYTIHTWWLTCTRTVSYPSCSSQ